MSNAATWQSYWCCHRKRGSVSCCWHRTSCRLGLVWISRMRLLRVARLWLLLLSTGPLLQVIRSASLRLHGLLRTARGGLARLARSELGMAPMVERHPLAKDHAEYSKLLLALRKMQGTASLKTE